MARDLAGALKHVIQAIPAGFVLFHMWVVDEAKLGADFRGAFIIPENDDFYLRVQQLPALQRIPLNHPVVPAERLSRRKKGQHIL